MYGELDTAEPQWIPLHEAAARLSHYLGLYTRFALETILARGRVPVLAMRSDVSAMMPDQVEALLAKASRIVVISHDDAVLAHYRFSSEQEADRLLGQRSYWRFANPDSPWLHLNADPDLRWLPVKFDQVRVCWTTLMRELRLVGWGPADEQAAVLRKHGLWSDSWGPIGSSSADESPHAVAAKTPDRGGSKKRKLRRDEKRPEIAQAVVNLAESEAWGQRGNKQRCELVEQHLRKPKGWCTVSTLRRAIADREGVLPQSTTSPL